MKGTVFNIQRFSLFDGPGVRTVVFLKGCPLRCIWCHNPEGLEAAPQLMYNAAKCIGCMECERVCPLKLHSLVDGVHVFDRSRCIACGKCAQVCCSNALSVAGQQRSVEEVMEVVMRDLPVYKESGGGITLSGGEPFFSRRFLSHC